MTSVDETPTDVKVSDLISQLEAAKLLDKNPWQVSRLISTGKLESVRLPTGNRAVIRSSLEAYQRGHK
jgi:CRISPR/Cas system-associated protein Cas5 (RAMP superfamily)